MPISPVRTVHSGRSFVPNPLFTVLMPAYNEAELIGEAVQRILDQEWTDFELLLVDDGSVDGTAEIARGAAGGDPRVRVMSKPNGGIASVYNFGIPQACGEFIVIAPVDDPLYSQHLRVMAREIAAHPEFDIFCSNGHVERPGSELAPARATTGTSHEVTLQDLIEGMVFAVGATYRRTLFERIGGYSTDVFAEDWDFFLRAMKEAGARTWYVDESLAKNVVRPRNKSADVDVMYRADMSILAKFRDEHTLSEVERAAVELSMNGKTHRYCLAKGIVADPSAKRGVRAAGASLLIAMLGSDRTERLIATVRKPFRR